MYSDSTQDLGCDHGHVVEFYESDDHLAASVSEFAGAALTRGAAAVIVATEDHRQTFMEALRSAGHDVDDLCRQDRLILLDAAATLAQFMVDGAPRAGRFRRVIGSVLDRAGRDGREISVYGEMVALLWDDGDVASTVALEALWNDLGRTRDFTLLCGYPLNGFAGALTSTFVQICDLHGDVVPAESFPRAGTCGEQRRAIAALQQEVVGLRAEVDALRSTSRRASAWTEFPQRWSADGARRPRPGTGRSRADRSDDHRLVSLREVYLTAILSGDGTSAEVAVREAMAIAEPATVHVEVIGAAMQGIGSQWEAGTLTVAQEHVATAVTSRVLGAVFDLLLRARPGSGARVLLAAPPGEHHVLGLRMTADLLEGEGHDARFLGADVPRDALLAMVRDVRPAALGLTYSRGEDASKVAGLFAAARRIDPDLRCFVGGRGARADVWPDEVPVVTDIRGLDEVTRLLADTRHPPQIAPRRSQSVPVVAPTAPAPSAPTPVDMLLRSAAESADLLRGHARLADELRRAAMQDPVTGGWNRRALDDHLQRVSAAPDQQPMTVLTIDLDDFKAVNDVEGHDAGDDLLRAVARTIEMTLRPDDFVARMGGDEFCVVLCRTEVARARRIGERIRVALNATAATQATRVSIGIAVHGEELRRTLARADEAMYAAKRAGGDAIRLAS